MTYQAALQHIVDSDPGPQSDQSLAHEMAVVARQALGSLPPLSMLIYGWDLTTWSRIWTWADMISLELPKQSDGPYQREAFARHEWFKRGGADSGP